MVCDATKQADRQTDIGDRQHLKGKRLWVGLTLKKKPVTVKQKRNANERRIGQLVSDIL